MKMTWFTVNQPNSARTACAACGEKIPKNQIRIINKLYQGRENFHLPCFTPKLKQFIRLCDLQIKLDEESQKIFKTWLDSWNSNFINLESPMACTLNITKEIMTTSPVRKRALIEIFKFLDCFEVVKSISLVSKEFYHVAWDQELWHFLFVRDYYEELPTDNWKKSYIDGAMNRCIECKQIPSPENFNKCPLLKKVLCKKCKGMKDYDVLYKKQIYRLYNVKADKLGLKFGQSYNNKKVVYRKHLMEALKRFRNENKKIVLETLRDQVRVNREIIEEIENIDVSDMERFGGWHLAAVHINYDLTNRKQSYKLLFNAIRTGWSGKMRFDSILQLIDQENN